MQTHRHIKTRISDGLMTGLPICREFDFAAGRVSRYSSLMPMVLRLAALVLAVAGAFFVWFLPNQPRPLSQPWDGPVGSVSFAPFREGKSPLNQIYPTRDEIEGDLAALKGLVSGIRTYSSLEGLQVVPELAGKYGIEVSMGAWLGVKRDINAKEIASLIDLANRYPDTIKRVIVGNEVLLRKDLKPAELAAYIRQVKAAVRQPVTYADVWEFWLRNPELAQDVDIITVHFLPYWEDFPVGVAHAMEHILAVHAKVQAAFPGKPILIGEVGWPYEGRSREGAVPGRWESAEFISRFLHLARDNRLAYNIVEAFDQHWKTKLEGTVGGRWGLLDIERKPVFSLKGPVVENPQWLFWFGVSVALALALLLVWRREVLSLPGRESACFILLVQAIAVMLAAALEHHASHSFDNWRQASALFHLAVQGLFALVLIEETVQRLLAPCLGASQGPSRHIRLSLAEVKPFWALYLPLGRGAVSTEKRAAFSVYARGRLGEWLFLLLMAMALYQTAMLSVIGRYRDFPIDDFLVPTFGLVLARLLLALCGRPASLAFGALFGGGQSKADSAMPGMMRPEAVSAYVLLALGVIMVLVEKVANREALAWAGLVAVMALPALFGWFAARRPD